MTDICEPLQNDKSGHILIPRLRSPNVDSETTHYLQAKGVFILPAPHVCEMLIRTYFHHVHPFFPIVEARSFLERFDNSPHNLSILLLWSMFLAAASVCKPFVSSHCGKT